MQLCSRCHKRMAVVFIAKTENNETKTEGLCLPCAQKMGLPPKEILNKMGINEEMLESLESEMTALVSGDETEDGGAPAIQFPAIFQNMGFPFGNAQKGEKAQKGKEANGEKPKKEERKFLSLYCTDLTAAAKEGKIDRIIGRDKELLRVIQILSRRQKNNPCLIGEPGVGKTAIAEALALRIVEGNVPYRLKNSEVFLLDLTALVAGTQFRGQFESRILGLLREVKSAGNIILVIDEVHNIVGSGDAEGGMNAANILKPALSRGEIQVIGATTLKEYRKYIEKDSALERRFQPVMVNEPSIEESTEMLLGIKGYYEGYHKVKIPNEVVKSAVLMSERYITDRFLPDKAIDLLDESCARLALESKELALLLETERELGLLREERAKTEALPEESDSEKAEARYRALADIKVRELQLIEKEEELQKEAEKLILSQADIAKVIEAWTGIPATDISASDTAFLSGLSERLSARIIGQGEAVSAVARAVKRKRVGISYKKTPVSFIFAGPTGVGKTELVRVLARDLFHKPESLIRLDMSEFMEKHAVSRIIGAPPGYVGYDEAGQLTEKIRRNPYSVILFDEIEKAHPDVLNILLQILDDGHITDAHGRQVNFENTVIVMTTNAGSGKSSAISGFAQKESAVLDREKTERALLSFLRPEFLNRVDEIITFASLSREDFQKIARIQLKDLSEALDEKGIRFTFTEEAADLVAKESYSEKYGARNMRRYIQTHVEDPLAEKMITHDTRVIGAHLSEKDGMLLVEVI